MSNETDLSNLREYLQKKCDSFIDNISDKFNKVRCGNCGELIINTLKMNEENQEINSKYLKNEIDKKVEIKQIKKILQLLHDPKRRKKAIRKYKLKSYTNRWSWNNFVYPIYSDMIDKGIISTRPRPNAYALKNYYLRMIRGKK